MKRNENAQPVAVTERTFEVCKAMGDLPIKISYKVILTADVDKGNTVQGVMKDATIETGKVVKVPGFIKIGEQILVNTVEDEYSERDTSK